MVEELLGNQAAVEHRRRTRTIAFAIGHQREIDFEYLGAGRFQCLARRFPERDHRRAGVDALPRWPADTRRIGRACFGVGVDVHARNAKALARQRSRVRGQCRVGGGTYRGDARNRHPGLQAPQVSTCVGIFCDHHVEYFEQVRHGSGEGHDDVHGRGQRPVAAYRDHAARRGVGAQPVVRGRAATTRPGFFRQTESGETCRGGRAGTVRRTGGERGGEVAGVVRALGTAVDAALHPAVGHRRHVGLAQADRPGGTQAFDGERIAIGDQVLEGRAAGSGGEALDQITVLGGVRDAVQRTQHLALGATGVGGLCFGESLGVAHHHRVQCRGRLGAVIGVDSREIGLDQFNRGGLAGFERGAQLGNGNFGNFDHAATAACRWRVPNTSLFSKWTFISLFSLHCVARQGRVLKILSTI
ncbi:hypothetical protein D3C80_776830 [compost metagenome]